VDLKDGASVVGQCDYRVSVAQTVELERRVLLELDPIAYEPLSARPEVVQAVNPRAKASRDEANWLVWGADSDFDSTWLGGHSPQTMMSFCLKKWRKAMKLWGRYNVNHSFEERPRIQCFCDGPTPLQKLDWLTHKIFSSQLHPV
jgi:hypothetical protein